MYCWKSHLHAFFGVSQLPRGHYEELLWEEELQPPRQLRPILGTVDEPKVRHAAVDVSGALVSCVGHLVCEVGILELEIVAGSHGVRILPLDVVKAAAKAVHPCRVI